MNRKLKTIFIATFCLVALYTLAGFIVIPMILESILPKKLTEALHRPVSVVDIRLNPYTLSFSVEGVDVKDKNGADPFISFDRLFVNIDGMSLFKIKPAIEEFSLEKPLIRIARLSQKEFNFSDLIPAAKPGEQKTQQEKKPLPVQFAVSNFKIIDGNVTFHDVPMKKTLVFTPINFTLPFISNFQHYIDTFATPSLEGRINETGVSVKLETKPFKETIETIVNLNLTGISVPYYFDYAPGDLGFKITEGSIDLRSQISFMQKAKVSILKIEGDVNLANLTILDRNDSPVLKVPNLKVVVSPFQPLQRQVKISSVIIENPEVNVLRDADGKINLLALGPPRPAVDVNTPMAEPAPDPNTPKEPFQLEVDQISLGGGKIFFTDQATARTASGKNIPPSQMVFDDVVLKLDGFSLAPETRISFDLKSRLNNEATVSAEGQTTLSPLSVDGKFDIGDISLQWIAPYIPENIRLTIADGRFNTSGIVKMQATPGGGIHRISKRQCRHL
jgi:uncharacterized protein involved in outer membrane biogenesis